MEKKMNNSLRRLVSSSVLFGFLAILLCAPNVRADVLVPSGGDPCDIDYDVDGVLDIYGTANIYQGAYALFSIYAYPGAVQDAPGSIVNIYGCAPGNMLWVLDPTSSQWPGLPPVVTVYGSSFQILTGPGAGAAFAPPDDQVISGELRFLDELGDVFSIWIGSDIPIHLRAPGSTEKERIEAELWVMPKVMHRQRRRPVIFATLRLPEDITKEDVDNDCRLVLYANDNEVEIEASRQRIYQSCRRRKSSRVKIFAFFNIGTLLDALPDNCEEAQIQVCGRLKSGQSGLKSGQEFYGNENIRIVSPRKKHWKHWSRRSSKYRHR